MTDIRARMVDAATNVIGLNGLRPDSYEDYLELVADGEARAVAEAMGRASGCGLVVRGLLARLGFVDPRLVAPYKFGSVMSSLLAMAHEATAYRSCAAWAAPSDDYAGGYTPNEGDILYLTNPEHVAVVVRVDPVGEFGGLRVYSIDGGQRAADGRETILARTRDIVLRGDGRRMALDSEHEGGAVRPVGGCIDLEALAARFVPVVAS